MHPHFIPKPRSHAQAMRQMSIRRQIDEETNFFIPDFIKFNVNGKEYAIRGETLQTEHLSDQRTRLDILVRAQTMKEKQDVCHFFDEHSNTFCFMGLSTGVFEAILNFQWNGYMHLPKHICSSQLINELKYWKVSESVLLQCCNGLISPNYIGQILDITPEEPCHTQETNNEYHEHVPKFYEKDSETQHMLKGSFFEPQKIEPKNVGMFDGVAFGRSRREAWLLIEDYSSSIFAKIFAIFSVSVALASIMIMIIGSLPDYQDIDIQSGTSEPIPLLQHLELACVVWFTIEYVTRLIITPKRWNYLKEPMQIVDILTIVPSYLERILEQFGDNMNLGSIRGAFLALRLLRVLRVARVFRLARYHSGLKQLGETLRISKREFSVLAVFFTTTVLLFSTSVYYLEKDVEGTPFISIPASCWWCVITITTVGYGDVVPITVGGQMVATCACLAGIIVLAFPITMIIENFNLKFREDIEEKEGRSLAPLKTPIRRIKF